MNPLPPPDLRILVATADRGLESHLSEILAALRYNVQTAPSAQDALRLLLDRDPPEIAMLDAALPGQSGLETAAEVRRRSGRKLTWIMLLSSAADPAAVAGAADVGVDDLILCRPADGAANPIDEADLRIRLGIAVRVLELARQLESQAQTVNFHATRDQLTGLWNRESLLTLLFPETDRVQRMGAPLGFLLLDLDHFARVNAEYGHETGDKVLQEIALRLRRYMRSYDLLGRSGDDEFLLVLPGCNSSHALNFAARIRTTLLSRPFSAGRDVISLTASIGLAQSRGRSPLVALREAERALAVAKHEGRNCEREYSAPRPRETWKEYPV